MNVIAYFQAYRFTHFSSRDEEKTKDGRQLSSGEKIKTLLFGIKNPRPENRKLPERPFDRITLKSNKEISCWLMRTDSSAKGTVILCHGYSGEKSSMLDRAYLFLDAGYNVLLFDFMGSGGSEGVQTTLGFHEAKQVKTVYDYLWQKGERKFILMGTSMGAVAIMKAQQDYQFKGCSLILECPFGRMLKTVKARFSNLHVPSFPMSELLVFWGGAQNQFNAFEHNPEKYACKINCPVLLMIGEQDEKVSMEETQIIDTNLKGPKTLVTYPLAGHENYLNQYKYQWYTEVLKFLKH